MAKLLTIHADLLDRSFRALRECGQGRSECVLYWTGPVDSSGAVDALDHPVHRRSFGEYEVDSRWLTDFWFRLARRERHVLAQIHTHPGAAFHSPTDDAYPIVSQAGFISIVFPNFGQGPVSLQHAWVGRLGAEGRWLQVSHKSAIRVIK